MPLLSTFGAASARGFGNLSGIEIPVDDLFNTVSALLHFDGTNNGVNNVFNDSSYSNHTITANGNVTQGSFGPFFRETVSLYSVTYDASAEGNYINFGTSTHSFWNSDFTLEFWIKTTATSLQSLFSSWFDSNFSGSSYAFNLGSSGGVSLSNGLSSTTNQSAMISTSAIVNDGNWHHVAYTQVDDGGSTKYFRVFIDGVLQAYVTESAWTQTATQNGTYIGSQGVNTYAEVSRRFVGSLSNLRLSHSLVYSTSSTTIGEEVFTPPDAALTAPTSGFLTLNSASIVDNGPSSYTINYSSAASNPSEGVVITKEPTEVYDPAVHGASAYFDGSGDYITLSPTSDFAFGTGDFSVSLWAYFTDVGAYDYLIDARNSGQTASTWALSFNYTNGAPNKLQFASGGTAILTSNTNVQADQWYYISVSRIGTTSKMHFNGVEVASNSSDSTNYSTAPNTSYIGSRHSVEHFFDGYISDLRVVKGTGLSSYTPPTTPLTAVTNTKLLLNMADGQAIDSAAQNNLTLYGDAKISNAQSKFGGTSMYFDGTGDEATYSSTGFGTGDFTMEAWVYPQTQPQRFPAVYFVTNGSSDRVAVAFDHDSQPNKFRCNVAGTVLSPSGTNAVDQWYHTAVVRYQGVITFYLNGTSVGSTAYTHNVGPETSFLGGNSPRSSELYFKGYIDDFRVSKTARYTTNFIPPTEPFADKGQ